MKGIIITFVLCILFVSFFASGEYLAKKVKDGKFKRWWRKNIIMEVDDNYPG